MEYLKVWTSFRELLEPLNESERGRLFTAMLEYAETGEVPELKGNERYTWPAAKQSIDNTRDKSEQMRSNRIKSDQTETNANKSKQTASNRIKSDQTETNANSPFDKEKDKVTSLEEEEEERETDNYNRAREAWLTSFGLTPTPALIRKLLAVGLSADLTAKAIRVSAGKAPAKPIDYVLSVLNDWRRERIASEDEADEYLLLLDGAAGKLPAVFTAEQAQTELEQFRQRKKAAS